MARSRRECWIVAVLVALCLLNGIRWARVIPPNRAPDELAHFDLCAFLHHDHRLPLVTDLHVYNKGGASYVAHPPMAGLAQALAMELSRPSSFEGMLLAARVADALLGAASVAVAWLVAGLLFPSRLGLRLLLPYLVAAVPQFTFVSGYVNDDAAPIFFSTLCLLVLLKGISEGWSWTRTIELGLAWGAVGLCKPTAYSWGPVGLGALLLSERGAWGRLLPRGLAASGIAIALSGWWYVRLILLYGRHFLQPEYNIRLPQTGGFLEHGYSFGNFWYRTNFFTSSFNSFWGNFDWMSLKMPLWHYFVLYPLSAIGFLSLTLWFLRERGAPERRSFLLLFFGALGTFTFSIVFSAYFDFQPQGRYLFPSIVPILALLLMGWDRLWPRGRAWVLGGIALFFLYLNLSSFELLKKTYAHLG